MNDESQTFAGQPQFTRYTYTATLNYLKYITGRDYFRGLLEWSYSLMTLVTIYREGGKRERSNVTLHSLWVNTLSKRR